MLVVHARPQPDGSVEVEFSSGSTIRARSGLIATGVAYRRLDIPGIEELIGRGVRYGSSSGGAAGYEGQRVAVVVAPTRPDRQRFTSPTTPPE